MKVAITGASGLIGRALQAVLRAGGHEPLPLARDGDADDWGWNAATLSGVDAVVHLAGEPIAGIWTARKKRAILESRVRGTGLIAAAAAAAGVPRLVSASGVGIYGDRGDEVLDETSGRGEGFLADVAFAWEDATQPAVAAGVTTATIRSGLVLEADGGVLPRILLPVRLGVGGPLGSGHQWWSWITLEDEARAIVYLIENDFAGPVNLVAPEPLQNADFVKRLAGAVGRPSFMRVPAVALRTAAGGAFADEVLLASQRVEPVVLSELGFRFRQETFAQALESLID